MKLAALEINEGYLMISTIEAMASALVTLIFCRLAFRVSLESRLKDLEHQVEILGDLEEAFLAQEDRIKDLDMETSRLVALLYPSDHLEELNTYVKSNLSPQARIQNPDGRAGERAPRPSPGN
jgi:hypothetical protein